MKRILGIEFGSTRIKAVLIDEKGNVVATGSHNWENKFENGLWTYSKEDILLGLQDCYADLAIHYGEPIRQLDAIGISAMMHGYLAFDENDVLLVPFRTWRNVNTARASEELSRLFDFNIPMRWSVSHFYQAYLDGEPHIGKVRSLNTLAGYVHYLLTGERCLGIGDASGMFPIDDGDYDKEMIEKLNARLRKDLGDGFNFLSFLPKIRKAGEEAGRLTEEGARLLDPTGTLLPGALLCPPEGDAGTGMVATNSVAVNTANVSAGTSSFLMAVLPSRINFHNPGIDMVTTPSGDHVAMVHTNTFTSEINRWVSLFQEVATLSGGEIGYDDLFALSKKSEKDIGGLRGFCFQGGEPIVGLPEAVPVLVEDPSKELKLADFMQYLIYSALAALSKGAKSLSDAGVKLTKVLGHGGFFKTEGVGQEAMSAALDAPVIVMKNAGEGGAWGIALLALYSLSGKGSLESFLAPIFDGFESSTLMASSKKKAQFNDFMERFDGLLEKAKEHQKATRYESLKKKVLRENLRLRDSGLVVLTWGNVSMIDREQGVIAIKPSGVSYDDMKEEDIVILDLEGNVIEGELNPSSDTPTHVYLYKVFPNIGGIVHTHSTYATSFAQTGKDIKAYGTTHADCFYGDVPCARGLTKDEIESEYELNTGKVIVETIKTPQKADEIPGILVKNHGVFTWGKDAKKAVDNAITLEEVAKMAFLSEALNPSLPRVDQYLLDKHYNRKHGKNAYYGQKAKKGE